MNEPLIPCPIKETMVYPSTCEKRCKYDKAKCAAAMEALKGETRHCLDCKHYGKVQPCKACMSADDPRERIFWEYGPPDKEEVVVHIEETAQVPTEVKNLEQLNLF